MSEESKFIPGEQTKSLKEIPWKIYISRALSAWSDRLWAFGGGIFMVDLAPENLRLVSFYGLVLSVSVMIFGALIGDWIDRSKRLTAAKVFLVVQNLSTAISCVILGLYFGNEFDHHGSSYKLSNIIIGVTIVLATIAQIASVGSRIVVEKDWIVVISMGDNDRLARINSVFQTIDLATMSLAPMSAGLIFGLVSSPVGAYFIAASNVFGGFLEYWLLKSIYHEFPELARKKIFEENSKKKNTNFTSKIMDSGKAWVLYMKYPVRNAGLGLAFLYMTVLGFDNITYGYCLQQCVHESVLGTLVGAGAIIGVLGSISFPYLRKSLGLPRTGLIGMWLLVSTLTLCLSSIWLEGSPFKPDYFSATYNATLNQDYEEKCSSESHHLFHHNLVNRFWSVGVLVTGIITGKFGLWISDLTITQLLQENVLEEHRGAIGGVQNALNSAMDTIKFVLVIILPQAETFGWLIMASFVSVFSAAMFYTAYALKSVKKSRI